MEVCLMSRPVSVENPRPQDANLSRLIDRALVFDSFFPETQRALLERWALETPHWMLNNASFDSNGRMQHRIWGASYMRAWKSGGWAALPPTLFSTMMTLFQKLGTAITDVSYIGLNGQLRGQDASMHTDCELDSPTQMSILIYIGENTDGDLLLFDKEDQETVHETIEFRPNRVIVFDGSIPHRAMAPSTEGFRISAIVRGEYRCARL